MPHVILILQLFNLVIHCFMWCFNCLHNLNICIFLQCVCSVRGSERLVLTDADSFLLVPGFRVFLYESLFSHFYWTFDVTMRFSGFKSWIFDCFYPFCLMCRSLCSMLMIKICFLNKFWLDDNWKADQTHHEVQLVGYMNNKCIQQQLMKTCWVI